MNAPTPPDKFRRYRDRQKARGLKEVRHWVYDLDAPGFREQLAAEIARINAAEGADDVERFMDAAWADLEATIEAAERRADPQSGDG